MDRRGIGTPYPYPAMRAAELSALHCGRSPGGRASGGRMTCSLVSAAPACTLQYRDRAMQHAAGPTRSGRPVGERGSGGAPAAPPGTGACSRTAAPGPAGTRPAGTARAHGPGRSAARRPPASRAAAAPAPSPYRSAAQGRALSAAIARRWSGPKRPDCAAAPLLVARGDSGCRLRPDGGRFPVLFACIGLPVARVTCLFARHINRCGSSACHSRSQRA